MITLKEGLEKQNLKINNSLKVDFNKELNNPYFSLVLEKIDLEENKLYKYTSRIKDCATEEQNCQNCKGLCFCKNEMKGYKLIPNVLDNKINFEYEACSYMKKNLKETSFLNNIKLYNEPSELKNARIKDIYVDDKSRVEVIKYINDYIKNYNKDRLKALYLTGSFGSGKTFLLACLLNELEIKKHISYEIVYYPELLRTLKEDLSLVESKVSYYSNVEILVLDDIGAENVTNWGRDEILGTILQERMNKHKTTFFTSNLDINELEKHLSCSKDNVDNVKARRIIERIKQLTIDMPLISVNRRN